MNNLINRVSLKDLPANCVEVKVHLKNRKERYGYLVETKKVTPFYFFVCNNKLHYDQHAEIEMIPHEQVLYIDYNLK